MPEAFADDRVDDAFDFAVAELGFRLPFELRMRHAHRNDGGQTFAQIVARGNKIFEQVFLLAVVVQRAREGGAKAGNVRAAFDGVDVVDVRVHVFGVLAAVLQGDFVPDAVLLAGDVDDVGMNRFAGAIEVLDEFDDAALVVEFVVLAGLLVVERRCARRGSKTPAPAAARAACRRELGGLEKICASGLKVVLVPVLVVAPTRRTATLWHAAFVFLLPDVPIAANLHFAPLATESSPPSRRRRANRRTFGKPPSRTCRRT